MPLHPLSENTSLVSFVIPDPLEMPREKSLASPTWLSPRLAQCQDQINTEYTRFNPHLVKQRLGLHEIASPHMLAKDLLPKHNPQTLQAVRLGHPWVVTQIWPRARTASVQKGGGLRKDGDGDPFPTLMRNTSIRQDVLLSMPQRMLLFL